jgi:hypothetical protein
VFAKQADTLDLAMDGLHFALSLERSCEATATSIRPTY